MKLHSATLLTGAGPPFLAAAAQAGFNGIQVVTKPGVIGGNPVLTCNVFATFDRPGEDRFLGVSGTPGSPMDIHVVGGTFYQNQFGGDTPPSACIGVFPSLAFDSFVTIGTKAICVQFPPPLVLSPGWPGFGPGSLSGTSLGWSNTAADPNTDPFNPDFYLGNGQILIGQFSTLDGIGIVGMFRVSVISNNVATQLDVSFSHFVPGPGALVLIAAAGLAGKRRRRPAPLPLRSAGLAGQ